jgi:aspartate kinase
MPSAIDSMSIIVSDDQWEGREATVLKELQAVLEPSRIETVTDLALIATVGEGMAYRVGVAGTLVAALAAAGVNVRMISQGASEISILIGVAGPDFRRAQQAIYDAFVRRGR